MKCQTEGCKGVYRVRSSHYRKDGTSFCWKPGDDEGQFATTVNKQLTNPPADAGKVYVVERKSNNSELKEGGKQVIGCLFGLLCLGVLVPYIIRSQFESYFDD